jgi:hypothetical protein
MRTLFLTSFRYINRSLLLLLLLQQQLLKDPHLCACSINVRPLLSPHFSFLLLLIINTFLNAFVTATTGSHGNRRDLRLGMGRRFLTK